MWRFLSRSALWCWSVGEGLRRACGTIGGRNEGWVCVWEGNGGLIMWVGLFGDACFVQSGLRMVYRRSMEDL